MLAGARPETREAIAQVLLDYMRRELAIKVDYLNEPTQDRLRQQSSQKLREPWTIDENERLERASVLFPRARQAKERREVFSGDTKLATLTYGHAAIIWRINLGWKRLKNKQDIGFFLDQERGYWASNPLDEEDTDDVMSASRKRVVPYVEDRRNCLLFRPEQSLDLGVMASLQAALKNAIQVEYQLEESELAAEPMPLFDERHLILFYEASEGGAGVLRRLVDDSAAFGEVCSRALSLLHFSPWTSSRRRIRPQPSWDSIRV